MFDYTVTFATLNCLEYTKACINSLLASGVESKRIVVVDNASSDGTQEYLKNINIGSTIFNSQNLSCGVAWNQGILSNQSEWTIIMNNDVIVNSNFAFRLINFAIKNKLKIVSPARIDGSDDYNIAGFANIAQKTMTNAYRYGSSNAVCMCIHWSVFNQIGFFRANPTLLGFEDGLFFNDVRKYNIENATTGHVWIHHFGSVTQEYIKMVNGKKSQDLLIKVNDRKLYGQTWLERKLYRYKLKQFHRAWRQKELFEYGMTLHGTRYKNEFIWL